MRKLGILFSVIMLITVGTFIVRPKAQTDPVGYKIHYNRYVGTEKITGHGTAFVLNDYEFLTVAHNVIVNFDTERHPYDDIWVDLDTRVPVTVSYWNSDLDIAIVRADRKLNLDPVVLGKEDPSEGDKLYISGSLKNTKIDNYPGTVVHRYHGGWVKSCAVCTQFDHGLSGSPLISNGAVVGLAVAGIQGDNGDLDHVHCLFLPVTVIQWFVKHPTQKTDLK